MHESIAKPIEARLEYLRRRLEPLQSAVSRQQSELMASRAELEEVQREMTKLEDMLEPDMLKRGRKFRGRDADGVPL
jgi:chromosome segregation ATPase